MVVLSGWGAQADGRGGAPKCRWAFSSGGWGEGDGVAGGFELLDVVVDASGVWVPETVS